MASSNTSTRSRSLPSHNCRSSEDLMVTSHDGIRGPACPVKSVITQRALNQSYVFVVSRNFAEEANWSALGDVGHVDAEGYLYLTDRATFMIISGGVNIYPQEIEDALVLHPKIADVAVVGVPDPEMGEAVKAVVQLATGNTPSPALADEIIAYARQHVAHYKCPKSVDFLDELPRLPTGKLYKRLLKDRYWGKTGSRIV
ncbi:MAG: hypothetical protein IPN63_09575 [Gammaproteobacteria bacterium]|nr:hypothetical protein [Gammaproteobacteria bacterium]